MGLLRSSKPLDSLLPSTRWQSMPTDPAIHDFHAHIYFDERELTEAQALAAEVTKRFGVPIGHFHVRPVGPHPRGSCQMTVQPADFGAVASFLAVSRDGLTIFAHASTGDDVADHMRNVIWFGPSEPLNLSIFGLD